MDVSFTHPSKRSEKLKLAQSSSIFRLSSDGHWCAQIFNTHLNRDKYYLYISRACQVNLYNKAPSQFKVLRLYHLLSGYDNLFFYRNRYIIAQSNRVFFVFDFDLNVAIDMWFIEDHQNIVHFDGENLIFKKGEVFQGLISRPIYTYFDRLNLALTIAQSLVESSGVFYDFLRGELYDPRLLLLIDQFDEKHFLRRWHVILHSKFFNSNEVSKDNNGNPTLNGELL